MGIVIFLFLLLIAFFSLVKTSSTYFYILYLSMFFLMFTMLKVSPNWAGGSSVYLYLIILMIIPVSLLDKSRNISKNNLVIRLILSFVFIELYLYVSAVFKGINPMNYVLFTKNFFYGYIVFIYFTVVNKSFYKNINKLLFIILAFESILGLMQYFGSDSFAGFFKIIEYNWNGGKTQLLGKSFYINKLVLGTLLRPSQFSDIIALLTVYFSGKYFFNRDLFYTRRIYLIILGFSTLAVLFAGIRTAFVSLIIGILLINYYKSKVNSVFVGLLILVMLFLSYQSYYQISQLSASGKVGIDNPLERISGLITVFSDFNKLDEHNALTLIRSIWLFPYLTTNPLFGAGLYWTAGYYGQLAAGSDMASWSDSTIIFFIVEFGLIGFLLLLSPYFIVLKYLKNNLEKEDYNIIKSVFIVLLVQTVTDPGLFNIFSSIIFLSIAGLEINKEKIKLFNG